MAVGGKGRPDWRIGEGGRIQARTRAWPARSPAWALGIGALCLSASAVLIDLSGASPGTASFYRCLLALPLLLPLAAAEHRDQGRPPRRRWLQPLAAGALFAGDILLWTRAIGEVGAGLSTVLVNVQVVIVPLLALAIDREPLPRRFLACLPFLLLGVVLTERPSLTQLAGCLLILASGYVATLHPRRAREDTRKRSRV